MALDHVQQWNTAAVADLDGCPRLKSTLQTLRQRSLTVTPVIRIEGVRVRIPSAPRLSPVWISAAVALVVAAVVGWGAYQLLRGGSAVVGAEPAEVVRITLGLLAAAGAVLAEVYALKQAPRATPAQDRPDLALVARARRRVRPNANTAHTGHLTEPATLRIPGTIRQPRSGE